MTQNSINTSTALLQLISSTTTSVVTCSTAMPADDTIPQNTEGTEVLTATITPKYSTSKLVIEFSGTVNNDTNRNKIGVALFQDSTANALAANSYWPAHSSGVGAGDTGNLIHIMTSGTTSATTFKIRIGPDANTCYVNADQSGNALFNSTCQAILTIKEIL